MKHWWCLIFLLATVSGLGYTARADTNQSFRLPKYSGHPLRASNVSAITPVIVQATTGPVLLLDKAGPDANQAAVFESVLFLRDPFSVRRVSQWWNLGTDLNTRVTIFVANLQSSPSAVVVNLVDNNNQTYNLTPEDVRPIPDFGFLQITFRLPDNLAPGICKVKVTANNEVTNTGTFRIALGAEQWRQDLQFLATQLPLLHKNAFFKVSRTQFEQAVADLDRDIPSLQDYEIVIRMMRIVALFGDSHTTLNMTGSTQQFRLYPMKLYWFSDGLYVTDVASQYREALGARLVRIGSTDVGQAYSVVSDLIPHENEQWLKALSPSRLVTPEILQASHILSDTRSGSFVFRDAAGREFLINLNSVGANDNINWATAPDPSEMPLYRKHPELNYWFDYLEPSHTLYFQYNVCQNRPDLPFTQFAQQMQDFSLTHPVDRFVIDLRNNTGGDSSILQPLINALASNPNINRKDRLFVIIGRLTFSSGLFNAIDLKQRTNATLIGEATGGKPNEYGEVRSFQLPNSHLNIFYSTKFFTTVAGDPPSLFPDTVVELSSADFFSGRDPVMESILAP